jgi:hypothetical protein
VRALDELGTTVVQSGGAVRETGNSLQTLQQIPFVGSEIARVGRRVSAAGVSAQVSGRSSRSAVRRLAIVLGLAVALAPSVPMLAVLAVTWQLARRRSV